MWWNCRDERKACGRLFSGPCDGTQVLIIGARCPYPASHLSLWPCFFMITDWSCVSLWGLTRMPHDLATWPFCPIMRRIHTVPIEVIYDFWYGSRSLDWNGICQIPHLWSYSSLSCGSPGRILHQAQVRKAALLRLQSRMGCLSLAISPYLILHSLIYVYLLNVLSAHNIL